MSNKPPRITVPGLNHGAGIPAGYVLGRKRGSGQGPAQLLNINQLQAIGIATRGYTAQTNSTTGSTAASATASLSTSVSSSLSSIVSTNVTQSTSLSQISSSLSGAISTNVGQSTSLSQVSSSLSGAISSTNSLSTAVSTVISGSISAVNSRIDSLSTAGGGGVTTFLSLTDTPDTYVGQAAKVVRVNAGETGLEFAAGSVDPGQSTSLSQISSSLSSEISSRASGDTSLSTVISGSISSVNSSVASLSTAVGGGGSLIFVAGAVIAGAAATTLTVSGLDLDAHGTYFVEIALKNATASVDTISMYYNADTTATNYFSSLTSNGASTQANNGQISTLFGSTSSEMLGNMWIKRPVSRILANGTNAVGTNSGTNIRAIGNAHQWTTTGTNVTGITISASVASSLDIGSRIDVWRVRNS